MYRARADSPVMSVSRSVLSVAGPIPGGNISAQKIAIDKQSVTMLIENAFTSGVRLLTYTLDVVRYDGVSGTEVSAINVRVNQTNTPTFTKLSTTVMSTIVQCRRMIGGWPGLDP